MPGYSSVLVAAQTAGAAVTGISTTGVSLLPGACRITLPSGYWGTPGKTTHVRASGTLTTVATAQALVLRFNLGAIATPITVAQSQPINMIVSAKNLVTWALELYMTHRSSGSGTQATFFDEGSFTSEAIVGSVAGYPAQAMWQASSPAVSSGFDSTLPNTIDLTAGFSTVGTDTIQLQTFVMEDLMTTP